MASAKAVAIRRNEAMDRLQAAAAALGKGLGVDVPDLRPVHKDPDIGRAMEIEAVASFLEDAAAAVTATAQVSPTLPQPLPQREGSRKAAK